MFNTEEMNLICIYETTSKTDLACNIRDSLPDVYDTELREIMETVIRKLEQLTDEEFSELGFFADYEDELDE